MTKKKHKPKEIVAKLQTGSTCWCRKGHCS